MTAFISQGEKMKLKRRMLSVLLVIASGAFEVHAEGSFICSPPALTAQEASRNIFDFKGNISCIITNSNPPNWPRLESKYARKVEAAAYEVLGEIILRNGRDLEVIDKITDPGTLEFHNIHHIRIKNDQEVMSYYDAINLEGSGVMKYLKEIHQIITWKGGDAGSIIFQLGLLNRIKKPAIIGRQTFFDQVMPRMTEEIAKAGADFSTFYISVHSDNPPSFQLPNSQTFPALEWLKHSKNW
jgi:hypothetical protein